MSERVARSRWIGQAVLLVLVVALVVVLRQEQAERPAPRAPGPPATHATDGPVLVGAPAASAVEGPPSEVPPPAPPEPPEPEATAAPAATGREVVCRDLASGAVVPGAILELRGKDDMPLVADAAGRVRLPEAADAHNLRARPPWSVCPTSEAAQVRRRDEIWLCRQLEIQVVLVYHATSDGSLPDFSRSRVVAQVVPTSVDGMPPAGAGGHSLLQGVYVEGRFLRLRDADARVDAQGHATLSAPRLPWLRVGAQVPGWHCTPVDVRPPKDPDAPGMHLRLELRQRPKLKGVLRGSDGAKIPPAELRLTTFATFASWERDVEPRLRELREEGNGGLGAHSRKDGSAVVHWAAHATTDAQGAFAIDVPRVGEGRLTALVPGYRPLVLELGTLDADRDLELTLEAVPPGTHRVLLNHGGTPIRAQELGLNDLTDVDRQGPSARVAVAADGSISTEWLVLGHYYMLGIQAPRASKGTYMLRWDGRAMVELTEIDMDLESALHRR
jgi:hypothetical protein